MSDEIRERLDVLARTLPCRPIRGADGSVYLYRFTLAALTEGGGYIYLHRFMRSDEDEELHNHPWSGTSLILAGGYREERRAGHVVMARECRRGDVNPIEPDTFHRVDLLEEDCWTLFVVGPVVQSWGFWHRSTGVFTKWREFIAAKGLVPR